MYVWIVRMPFNRLHVNKNFNCALRNAVTVARETQRMIAWWEGDTKREKEDERLEIASGTVLSNDRLRSRLLGKHKFDAKELFPT